ncbi:hypothetical protein HHI36_017172, partial [Cryptolaemus montrouzieri]
MDRINDVVYRNQKLPRGKLRIVHSNRLAPFAGNNEEAVVYALRPIPEKTFEQFTAEHVYGHKSRNEVTSEEQRDLFVLPEEYASGHCVSSDLKMSKGVVL